MEQMQALLSGRTRAGISVTLGFRLSELEPGRVGLPVRRTAACTTRSAQCTAAMPRPYWFFSDDRFDLA